MTETLTTTSALTMMQPGQLPSGLEHVETPAELDAMHQLSPEAAILINAHREAVMGISRGEDPRMMVWARPCSLDDSVQPDGAPSALAFVQRIHELRQRPEVSKHLFVGTGLYPAKPRTGGKKDDFRGLDQRDPVAAHRLITEAANTGVPLRMEVLSGLQIARYASRQAALQVGARDIGSTMLRVSLSATDVPVFCKNPESGNPAPALRAMETINTPQSKAEIVMPDGRPARFKNRSPGNPNTIFSYRGGANAKSPESYEERIKEVSRLGIAYEVDNSHAVTEAHDPEGRKSVKGQVAAFEHNVRLLSDGSLARRPASFLLESYLLEGSDPSERTPGMSWTDPGIGIDQTEEMILELARVHARLVGRG